MFNNMKKVGLDNLYMQVNWQGLGFYQFFDSMVFKRGDMINPEFNIADCLPDRS